MTVVKIKKAKGTKNCVVKIKLNFQDYKNFLKETQLEYKTKNLEKIWNWRRYSWKYHKEFIKSKEINIKNIAKI